jgi:hypothetical protein
VESDDRAHGLDELQISDVLQGSRLPNGVLGCLRRREIARSAAVPIELDAACQCPGDDERGVAKLEAAELEPGRKHECVGSEAVTALVRRDPQLLFAEPSTERTEDRVAVQRTARIAHSVTADEDELLIDSVPVLRQVDRSEVVWLFELYPPHVRR